MSKIKLGFNIVNVNALPLLERKPGFYRSGEIAQRTENVVKPISETHALIEEPQQGMLHIP
jgi:hypothetical protein